MSTGTGPFILDLVADGPHAVIGGTTGSGKSELLISWILALATTCSPAEVNFLLVDFKGGSSFAAVSRLPHTVGLITDLDPASAGRALASLRAELRHRERAIADAGARGVDDLAGDARLPRLVIVVDEFAVVDNDFPQLQPLFADLAARGRSLGIHLILCTQRPFGVIRDSVLANCSIRLSLRVNNGADSTAVIGTAAASRLPVTPHGRCYLSVGGAVPLLAQVALATEADAEVVGARWAESSHRVRRPWRDPLPAVVVFDDIAESVSGAALVFGLCDVPETQSQPVADYSPARDGNLIVLGGHNSGKTGMLAALEEASGHGDSDCLTVRIPDDVEGAWDVVDAALAGVAGVAGVAEAAVTATSMPKLYLIDDADALLARFDNDYGLAFADRLGRLLREGPNRGIRVVMTAARLTSALQQLAALCDSRLLLRMPSRQDFMLAGGDGQQFCAELPPGGGLWRGHRVQVMYSPSCRPKPTPRTAWPIAPGQTFALVAANAHNLAVHLQKQYGGGQGASESSVIEVASPAGSGGISIAESDPGAIVIGAPLDWQSHWSMFATAHAIAPVVFLGCTAAEFRSVTGLRPLPPPIGHDPRAAWMLWQDGAVTRVAVPDELLL